MERIVYHVPDSEHIAVITAETSDGEVVVALEFVMDKRPRTLLFRGDMAAKIAASLGAASSEAVRINSERGKS